MYTRNNIRLSAPQRPFIFCNLRHQVKWRAELRRRQGIELKLQVVRRRFAPSHPNLWWEYFPSLCPKLLAVSCRQSV